MFTTPADTRLGSLLTPATWIRNFVRAHPDYKHDSVVSAEINYDLMVAVDEMYVFITPVMTDCNADTAPFSERGVRRAPDLLPDDYTGGEKDKGTIGL